MPRAAVAIGANLVSQEIIIASDCWPEVLYGTIVTFNLLQGDRPGNIRAALRALHELDVQVFQLSRLYESAPAYVTDQPAFLNAAALVDTQLRPLELLQALKQVEAQLGRDFGGQRWGPRPIDLDIIFYEGDVVNQPGNLLVVPHPRWQERAFVQAPLADLWPRGSPEAGSTVSKGGRSNSSSSSSKNEDNNGPTAAAAACEGLEERLLFARQLWEQAGGESQLGDPDLECVMPLGGKLTGELWRWQRRAQVMGIINVTPDSFSDGGRHYGVEAALEAGRRMVAEGADVIDVGGQSTHPASQPLTPQEEVQRVVPVIRALAEDEATRGTPLSIDTYYAEVAEAAVAVGASIVNDVSGGLLDERMLPTVAELGVPYVLMHMRGTPQTMQSREHTAYTDVCAEVTVELQAAGERALAAGIEPWRLILDPGLGFAKAGDDSMVLMASLRRLRRLLSPPLRHLPLLLGPSRKGFLGRLTGRKVAAERDHATAAAAALCVAEGANIVRAHNVPATCDALRVVDAFCKVRPA
ncbi:hypothetical protein N2152v2_007188 [Parachlorella kessleri]